MSSKIICELEKLDNKTDLRLELQSFYFPQQAHLRSPIKQDEKPVSVDIVRQSDKDTTIIADSIGKRFPKMKIISVVDGRNMVWTFQEPICDQISFRRDNGETIEHISVNFAEITFEIIAPIGADGNSQTNRVKTADKHFKKTMDFLRG